jgi:hypothetical protein
MFEGTREHNFFREIIESNLRIREAIYDQTKPYRGKKNEAVTPIHTPHPIMSLPPESHVLLGFATSPHQYAYRVKRQIDNPERGGNNGFLDPNAHLDYFKNIIDKVQKYTKSDVRENGINIRDILKEDEYFKALEAMAEKKMKIVTDDQKNELKNISEKAGLRLKERMVDEIVNIGLAENRRAKQ